MNDSQIECSDCGKVCKEGETEECVKCEEDFCADCLNEDDYCLECSKFDA